MESEHNGDMGVGVVWVLRAHKRFGGARIYSVSWEKNRDGMIIERKLKNASSLMALIP